MKKKVNKSGLSRIAINFIIILLIVIIGGVIFILVRNIMSNQGEQDVFDDSTLDLKISQIQKVDDSTLDVVVKRNEGEGEFVALSFAVDDGALMEIIRVNSSMPEMQEEVFSLNFVLLNSSKIKRVSVTPIFLNKNGEEIIGNIKDEYITPNVCSNYCPTGAQCGVNDCGIKCGSGCNSGYLCLNYKCIKEKRSSGGGGGGSSSSDDDITPTCTDTCASFTYQCGTQTVCGEIFNCGTCSTGYVCSSGLCIEEESCVDTCSSLEYACGNVCGINCGTCSTGYTCQISNGTCMKNCVPTTCSALGRTCGSVSDGCGGTLNCGTCTTGYSCAVNGTCIKEVVIDCGSVTCKSGEYCSNGVCLLTVSGNTYFVATNGNDNNPGTFTQPWGTWQKAFNTADAGDIVYFRGGVWYPTVSVVYDGDIGNSGTESKHIIYQNYPNEVPILDLNNYNYATSMAGLDIRYVTNVEFRGLTIRNNKQDVQGQWISGLQFYQCGNLWVDRITSYGHGGYGIWFVGYDSLYLTNSDSYDNVDYIADDPGNRADGFQVSVGGRNNTYTYISGCRSWNNSDDGFEISSLGELEVSDCWSFGNGRLAYGGGVGYHLTYAYEPNPNKRIIHNTFAIFNDGDAYTENNLLNEFKGPVMSFINNLAYRCPMGFTSSPGIFDCEAGYANVTYKNNIVYNSTYGVNDGNYPSDGKYPSYYDQTYLAACNYGYPTYATAKNNTWIFSMNHSYWDYNPAVKVTNDDFVLITQTVDELIPVLTAPRKADGSLPDIGGYFHLAQGSDLIDKGVYIPGYHCTTAGAHPGENCVEWYGSAPDLGPFESNY